MSTMRASRLVLKCDEEGRIQHAHVEGAVRLDADAEASGDLPRLALLVDRASAAKCERFLAKARGGAAFGWELQLPAARGPCALLFAGLRRPDGALLVMAAESGDALLHLLDGRGSLAEPDSAGAAGGQAQSDSHAAPFAPLDELTRVNNELVALHRELAKRNAELSAVTKQRNELLAVAAHDLRNPLQVVQGYCDMLKVAGDLSPGSQHELIERVQHASELMLRVLEDTLEYARLEGGKVRPHKHDVDLASLVQECVRDYARIAEQKGIVLSFQAAPQLPALQLDPTHVTQIVENLLSNAIKYSDAGGRVELTLSQSHDQIALDVTDQGRGIAADEVPLLFRPFQTTSTRPTAGEPSTGLGLAIVRRLVEANGGSVSVRSALHRGATFTVHFPSPEPSSERVTGVLRAPACAADPPKRAAPGANRTRSRSGRGQS